MQSDHIIHLAQSVCFQYFEVSLILFNFEDKKYIRIKNVIMEEYNQDTVSEFFIGTSNLCHKIESENGNEDIRVYHYNLGKAITCLYILNDTFQGSRDEITG